MTPHPIRVARADDAERFLATDQLVWFDEEKDAPVEDQLLVVRPEGRFAAYVDDAAPTSYAGVYGVYPMTLAAPGPDAGTRQLSCAGLSWVGVHPDHRRQGVLSAMIRHHLEQVREEPGTHVSALHASEPAIYGRFGYGLASLELEVTLARGTTFTAPHLESAATATSTRLSRTDDPGMPKRMRECHLATAGLGAVVGGPEYYEQMCRTFPEELRGKEPWRVLFARRAGVDVGFAQFRRKAKWERGRPGGEVVVWALVGDPAARLALLRRLVDLDLMGSVNLVGVGAEDPLLHWVGGPRRTTDVATYDSLWVRLVDLPEALAERAWSAPCDVVVDVADRYAPWNEGRWRIHAADGRATAERTDRDAEVALDVAALGAAYLGGSSLVTQHQAGFVLEQRPGAVAELGRAMRTDLTPTGAVMF